MVEEHVRDLLPGYALGCLDEQELLQVARHLPNCSACRAEMETYWSTTEQLALVVPVQIPPPHLKRKLMARIEPPVAHAAAQASSPARSVGDWLAALFGNIRPSVVAWGAVAALLIVILLGASSIMLWSQVNQLQARVPAENVRIVRLAGTPNAPGAQGYLMVFADEPYGTLVVEDAPLLDPDQQYQLWLIKDGKRTSGGVFTVDEHGYGSMQVDADQPLENFPSFGVTIEPAGGSPGPTGDKVLGGDS